MAPGEPAWKSVGELASIGMTMVLATVIGLAGGYYADRWLGTRPIFLLVGLGLGVAAGVVWPFPAAVDPGRELGEAEGGSAGPGGGESGGSPRGRPRGPAASRAAPAGP